jgi:hypothetical protein
MAKEAVGGETVDFIKYGYVLGQSRISLKPKIAKRMTRTCLPQRRH